MSLEWWLTLSKIVGIVAQGIALIAGASILYFGARADANRKVELSHLASVQQKLAAENAELRAKDDEKGKHMEELVGQQQTLASQNTMLASGLEKHRSDLQLRNARISDLEEKAKHASRGIAMTYDYNGARRKTSAGRSEAIAGPEMQTYARMVELEQNGKFDDLTTLCKKEIRKTPEWLTPRMFLGSTYANSGQKQNAIREFEYVVDKAAGDPEYAKAAEYLKLMKKK